jgi:hypothetical protein
MKQLNRLFHPVALTQARGAFLAGMAVLAVVVLSTSALHSRAQAAADSQGADPLVLQAEVFELLSGYHGALAYGGNLALTHGKTLPNG